MAKKFVSVTLDLDEETLKVLEGASLKKGSSLSDVAQELISKALQEISEEPAHGGEGASAETGKVGSPE